MRMYCKFFMLFLCLSTLNACTVGRYVTNVSLNDKDSLAIEKCTTKKWDMFFWNTECSTSSVKAVSAE
jgi:hypothetical protein